MTEHDQERRRLLRTLGLWGMAAASSNAIGAVCVAPDGGDSSLRQSLHYVESSTTPNQKCGGCSFFSSPQGACGTCQIFSGPANVDGHCDSWAARS